MLVALVRAALLYLYSTSFRCYRAVSSHVAPLNVWRGMLPTRTERRYGVHHTLGTFFGLLLSRSFCYVPLVVASDAE